MVDVASGRIAGEITGQGANPSIAWGAAGGDATSSLVLVAAEDAVSAYRVKPSAASPRTNRP